MQHMKYIVSAFEMHVLRLEKLVWATFVKFKRFSVYVWPSGIFQPEVCRLTNRLTFSYEVHKYTEICTSVFNITKNVNICGIW
jgi:hypothetical protein